MFICLSVCVGSAWKILPVTAHTDRQTDTVQGWPPVLPPLYGQGTGDQHGRGGGGHGWGRTNGCIMHRVHTSSFLKQIIKHQKWLCEYPHLSYIPNVKDMLKEQYVSTTILYVNLFLL
jgi:hypothetical protein